jgi:hypothetical protein
MSIQLLVASQAPSLLLPSRGEVVRRSPGGKLRATPHARQQDKRHHIAYTETTHQSCDRRSKPEAPRPSTNTSTMSEHTLDNGGVSLLDDVDMEDLSDLAEALLPETAPQESNNAQDDAEAMDDVMQSLPAGGGAADAHNDAHDDTTDTNNMSERTSAEPETTPDLHGRAASHDQAATRRLDMLQSLFASQDVELKHFAPPPQCAQQPDLAEDILETFLDHATFTVKIWVNFDAAERVFFGGNRAEACGKLQIPKKKLQSLLELDSRHYNFSHVRLEIGTPFRTLAEIVLNVREQDGETLVKANGKMYRQHPPIQLPILADYLTTCVKKINNARLNTNLNMDDLGIIASIFRRRHDDDDYEDEWEKPCYGFGEWAGVEEPTFRRGIRW